MHIIRPTQPLQRVIYTDDSSKFLKCCDLAAITAIAYRPSSSYRVEPTSEGSIKLAQPFLRTSQSTSFGACFRDNSQKSTFTCINT